MFEVGMQVLCLKQGTWLIYDSLTREFLGIAANAPKYNEIVTITSIGYSSDDRIYLIFQEYNNNNKFNAKWFVPLVSDNTLLTELESIFLPVEANI
jgi:hypothetical protein